MAFTGIFSRCFVGTNDQDYQTMQNIIPRQTYAIRFKVGNFDAPTPQTLSLNLQSTGPGDWVVLAVPYPKSAWSLQVNYLAYSSATLVPMTRGKKRIIF